MKGDFSRQTFDPKKHYSSVLMQQGRVQLDADWNEQQAIDRYRDETTALDVIGACGAPMDDAGFAITTDGKTLFIGKGRMYVDGILCENDTDALDYALQPDLPYRPSNQQTVPTIQDLLSTAKANAGIVYLDVWQRHLTALDDDLMREKALGGPDTTTRVKTVWQVRMLPINLSATTSVELTQLIKEEKSLETQIAQLNLSRAKNASAKIKELQTKLDEVRKAIATLERQTRQSVALTCDGEYSEWDQLTAPSKAKLNAQTQPPQKEELCQLPPSAGYQRLENQLYRVEIHNGGTLKQGVKSSVTFKWSRDNGTVVTSIDKISGQQVTVHDVGPDAVLGFATGQWVEVSDDWLELNGEPGQLLKITDVNQATRVITLDSAPTPLAPNANGVDPARHPKLRRWDQDGNVGTSTGVPGNTNWIDLEGGIQVQLSEGAYKTGDYWLIPARTATGEIEWPPFQVPNTSPIAQNALGIHHHYCRLALVDFNKETIRVTDDCRNLFPPLTKVCAGAKAIYVTGTNWKNDDWFPFEQFLKEGLRINFNTPPDLLSLTGAAVEDSSATMIVSLELPSGQATTSPDIVAILDGTLSLGTNAVQWMPRSAGNNSLLALVALQPFVRVHVTLKGSCIWSKSGDKLIYLDGQALGQPGLQSDNKTPRIDLVFPTGGCARASDFESWFYAQTRPTAAPLQIQTIDFFSKAGKPSSAGTIKGAPNASAGLTVDDQVGTINITFNRPVDPRSVSLQSVILSNKAGAGNAPLLYGLQTTGNVVRVNLEIVWTKPGAFELLVAGDVSVPNKTIPVKAADDKSSLDGNYDAVAGGNFVLPIKVG